MAELPRLPPPPGTKRRKTSIRTVGATTQEQFLDRLRALRDDPTVVIPECTLDVPAVQRIRARLARIKDGKAPLLARFDKGIVGTVAKTVPMAKREAATRLLDVRVDGQRRFFLTVGHLPRPIVIGVQNHDDPLALLLAWGGVAQKEKLWFFAGSQLWCTGHDPKPPTRWFEDLGERLGVELAEGDGVWLCPHGATERVLVSFPGGPGVAACVACCATNPLRFVVEQRVLAPDRSAMVEVAVLRTDGGRIPIEGKRLQAYRTGRVSEADLVRQAMDEWRKGTGGAGARWVLGSRDFGTDQAAFLEALEPRAWERKAVEVATAQGHVGVESSVNDVLLAHPDRLVDAVATLLGDRAAAFAQANEGLAPADLLRQANEEAERQRSLAALPPLRPRGPLAAWLDDWTRFHLTHGRLECLERLRREARKPPVGKVHMYALTLAMGSDLSVETHYDNDQKAGGRSMEPYLRAVLTARGADYPKAVQDYLDQSGSGETMG